MLANNSRTSAENEDFQNKDIERAKVLLVDDRKENLLSLEALLEELDITILTANSGNEALSLLFEYEFAVVLMDVQMPEMDGFETADLMRGNKRTKSIPIIFVTAISKGGEYLSRGYEAGAVDYLYKPLDAPILRSKVTIFVELFQMRKLLEVKNRKLDEISGQLREAALIDHLTGLRNRRYLSEVMTEDIPMVQRINEDQQSGKGADGSNTMLGFLMIDVDHFKRVNDEHGHDAGDAVLVKFSEHLRTALRGCDSVIRWGGEEFLGYLRRTDGAYMTKIAERVRSTIDGALFQIPDGTTIKISCSVGCCYYPVVGQSIYSWEDVVAVADAALLLAKKRGRNKCIGVEIGDQAAKENVKDMVIHSLELAAESGLVKLIT
jgi:diguanylate cyclase (GGDEF)-like protein